MPSSIQVPGLSHSVTRPFSYSRIQFFVLSLVSILLTTLFSIVTVATSGYEFQTKYESDLDNATSLSQWYQQGPFSWVNNMRSTCQDGQLVVGSSYQTYHKTSWYTVDGIMVPDSARSISEVAYRNYPLEECHVGSITINLKRQDDSRASHMQWSWTATTATALIGCTLNVSGVYTGIYLVHQVPDTHTFSFNNQMLTSLIVGHEVYTAWFDMIGSVMAYSVPNTTSTDLWSGGSIMLGHNQAQTDIRSTDFFTYSAAMYTEREPTSSSSSNSASDSQTSEQQSGNLHMSQWHPNLPQINITIDAFAKSYLSYLELDLGIPGKGNAFLQTSTIDYLRGINDTAAWTAAHQNCTGLQCPSIGTIDFPINDALRKGIEEEGPVSNSSSTFLAQYLCSVPQPKGVLAVIYAVVLADLVFLHACWAACSAIAVWWTGRKDKSIQYCEGCLELKKSIVKDGEDELIEKASSMGAVSNVGHTSRQQATPGEHDDPMKYVEQPLLHQTQ